MNVCTRPPRDWEPCRRDAGHDGPCSPYPDHAAALLPQPQKRLSTGDRFLIFGFIVTVILGTLAIGLAR